MGKKKVKGKPQSSAAAQEDPRITDGAAAGGEVADRYPETDEEGENAHGEKNQGTDTGMVHDMDTTRQSTEGNFYGGRKDTGNQVDGADATEDPQLSHDDNEISTAADEVISSSQHDISKPAEMSAEERLIVEQKCQVGLQMHACFLSCAGLRTDCRKHRRSWQRRRPLRPRCLTTKERAKCQHSRQMRTGQLNRDRQKSWKAVRR